MLPYYRSVQLVSVPVALSLGRVHSTTGSSTSAVHLPNANGLPLCRYSRATTVVLRYICDAEHAGCRGNGAVVTKTDPHPHPEMVTEVMARKLQHLLSSWAC